MYKVLMLLYGLSAILTILTFYGMNVLSAPVQNDDFGGGNGNPALVIPVFLMPFILYFVYGTIELSMRAAGKWLSSRSKWLGILVSSISVIGIFVYTLKKANDFRTYIVVTKEAYNNPEDFALLTIFSNHIFFNPLTFAMLVISCFGAGVVWSLIRASAKENS